MESCAQKKAYKAKDYKSDLKPIWCPGCGDYTVLNSITRALAELGGRHLKPSVLELGGHAPVLLSFTQSGVLDSGSTVTGY